MVENHHEDGDAAKAIHDSDLRVSAGPVLHHEISPACRPQVSVNVCMVAGFLSRVHQAPFASTTRFAVDNEAPPIWLLFIALQMIGSSGVLGRRCALLVPAYLSLDPFIGLLQAGA